MMRRCDGSDELVGDERARPRFCGLTFDDVEHSTICPHRSIGPKLTDAEIDELYDAAIAHDRPLDLSKFRPEIRERLQAQDRLLRGLGLNVGANILEQLVARIRRLLRTPRVVAVTRRPAGWLAVGRRRRRRLVPVVAWALREDGQVVGLVADRRGLHPATGRLFRGYLPGAALSLPGASLSDAQLSPPAVAVPVGDLEEAIRDIADPSSPDGQAVIYDRLRAAADAEWALLAFAQYTQDPLRFLRNHFALIAEHGHRAELDDDWRAGLAAISKPAAVAAIQEEKS
jgi:hypothetical protein